MKKSHLFGILIIAACVMIIIATAGDASSYVSFKDAHELSAGGHDKKVHVVGHLKKGANGQIVGLEPSEDKLSFSFVMVDENNQEQQVFYKEPMPADFTKSEQVVVIGGYQHNAFIADKILMKCPSKYQEKEITQVSGK